MRGTLASVLLLALFVGLSGCDSLFGSKEDPMTDEIFEEGRIDPRLIEDIGYVPLSPFFQQGVGGVLDAPMDVYVGYDEFIYVVDARGLHVLDLAGRPQTLVELRDAVAVTQDRRLHVYVAARRDTVVNGETWDLPVVYRFSGISAGQAQLEDIIWHPFDDDSRRFNRRDPIPTDEEVTFTGVAPLPDNRIYVARRGPVNLLNSPILPHNAIMEFSPDGINTQTINALHPLQPSLRSAVNPAGVLTFMGPPQRASIPANNDFVLIQSPAEGTRLQYPLVSIRAVETSDGISYLPDQNRLSPAIQADTSLGDGFLFEEFKFEDPSGLAYANDGTNYLFVLDAGTDSLFVFTNAGVEGVAPPPGARSTKPVVVSFGGTGSGALEFRNPNGVAYFDRVVYVADTGNNRISRFRLNTDFE